MRKSWQTTLQSDNDIKGEGTITILYNHISYNTINCYDSSLHMSSWHLGTNIQISDFKHILLINAED
jgi:hypothetical protein